MPLPSKNWRTLQQAEVLVAPRIAEVADSHLKGWPAARRGGRSRSAGAFERMRRATASSQLRDGPKSVRSVKVNVLRCNCHIFLPAAPSGTGAVHASG